LVVDPFIRVHQAIKPEPVEAGPPRKVLDEIVSARKSNAPASPSPRLEEIAASADEMLTLYDLARGLAGQVSFNDAGDVIANHLKRLVPSALCVFYIHDRSTSEIQARHAVGEGAASVKGMRISVGQRLSGWVAANRQTISNSDPVLDLGDIARAHSAGLRSCLSTPLLSGDALIGVVSLYSPELNAFTEDHKRIIEAVGRQIAHTLERASEFDVIMRRDELTGLPSVTQLERIVVPAASGKGTEHKYSLLFIDVSKLDQISLADGASTADDVLRHVVPYIRSGLRVADLLFRKSNEEFVAFLSDTDAATAEAVAQRVVANIVGHPITLATGKQLHVEVSVRTVCCPRDGYSLDALLRLSAPRISEKNSIASTTRVH